MRILSLCLLVLAAALPSLSVLRAQSIYFNGTGANINFGDVADLGSTFTLEAWTKSQTGIAGANNDIISKVGGGGSTNGYELAVAIPSSARGGVFNSVGTDWAHNYGVWGSSASTPEVWFHLALTYDNDTLRLYENGSLIASHTVGAHAVINTANPLMIGGNANNMNWWQGWIDEVSIWSVARTAAEIQNSYLTSLSGSENGLLAYWNFDAGSGASVSDVFGQGLTSNLNGGASWSIDNAPIPEPSTYAALAGLAALGLALGKLKRRA
jgi:hypothetical protein